VLASAAESARVDFVGRKAHRLDRISRHIASNLQRRQFDAVALHDLVRRRKVDRARDAHDAVSVLHIVAAESVAQRGGRGLQLCKADDGLGALDPNLGAGVRRGAGNMHH
jgi:hypothetical protein